MSAGFDADEVTWITDEVAITNFFSAHSKEVLARHRIRAVLCLDRDLQGCCGLPGTMVRAAGAIVQPGPAFVLVRRHHYVRCEWMRATSSCRRRRVSRAF